MTPSDPKRLRELAAQVDALWTWNNRQRAEIRAALERLAEVDSKAASAEAYGLPNTYSAAVEEVHEWREAADGGAMTPSALRRTLAELRAQLARARQGGSDG